VSRVLLLPYAHREESAWDQLYRIAQTSGGVQNKWIGVTPSCMSWPLLPRVSNRCAVLSRTPQTELSPSMSTRIASSRPSIASCDVKGTISVPNDMRWITNQSDSPVRACQISGQVEVSSHRIFCYRCLFQLGPTFRSRYSFTTLLIKRIASEWPIS
jgi:hypothetical protein